MTCHECGKDLDPKKHGVVSGERLRKYHAVCYRRLAAAEASRD